MTDPPSEDNRSSDVESEWDGRRGSSSHGEDHTDEDNRTFTKFPQLPAELRVMIWEYAVPSPRDIPGAIMFITDFDLSNPRAILPSPHEITLIYTEMVSEGLLDDPWEDDEDERDWALVPGTRGHFDVANFMVRSWQNILSLLQTCHEARNTTRGTFQLACDPSIGEEFSTAWWDDEAIIYFPTNEGDCRKLATLHWLALLRCEPLRYATSIRTHLGDLLSF